MRIINFLFLLLFTYACTDKTAARNDKYNTAIAEDTNNLINAYIFLEQNHDLLHIMMGEYEGNPEQSLLKFKEKIQPLKHNPYLLQVNFMLELIKVNSDKTLDGAASFDSLVDYYQMGYQLMIEGCVKAYKMPFDLPQNIEDYKNIKKYFGWE